MAGRMPAIRISEVRRRPAAPGLTLARRPSCNRRAAAASARLRTTRRCCAIWRRSSNRPRATPSEQTRVARARRRSQSRQPECGRLRLGYDRAYAQCLPFSPPREVKGRFHYDGTSTPQAVLPDADCAAGPSRRSGRRCQAAPGISRGDRVRSRSACRA